MKHQRVRRDPLRALTSEVLPYEVPLPFNTVRIYAFLRRLRFTWVNEHSFGVLTSRLGKAEKYWLELIFDGIALGQGTQQGERTVFDLAAGSATKHDLRHPYKFRGRRNNGKNRNLVVPHPQSMLKMAYFINQYSDSIVYYTNRSNFSIRHPQRVARLQSKGDAVFTSKRDKDSFGFEQFDLEYEHVSSYFSYKRYNNINRFYSSQEFRACERKYPKLVRADVSKCFDSIYTHTLSWVTNGSHASKNEESVDETFGAKFDHYMQYLNYAETSGIIIGPEFSRVFAEIILQEVDVRVERDLARIGLMAGQDYEIMRYVDDYFVFLADARKSDEVEEVLARNLAEFKLHLNDHKQHQFETPLKSHMSVAKIRMREMLKSRTQCDIDTDVSPQQANLFLSASKAILDYKSVLIDSELEHGEVANSYLYELGRRTDKTVRKYAKYLSAVKEEGDTKKYSAARTTLVKYLVSVLDVAVFVYAGAPSVSHSVKLTKLIVNALRELERNEFGLLETQSFRDKVSREITAQLAAVRDESSFGVHTLLLVDCLVFLNPNINESALVAILKRRGRGVKDLDAFGVLTFLRRFWDHDDESELKADLLGQAQRIISSGKDDPKHNAERVILLLSLPTLPGASIDTLSQVTGISKNKLRTLRRSRVDSSMFAWNASDDYHERLQLKTLQMVY